MTNYNIRSKINTVGDVAKQCEKLHKLTSLFPQEYALAGLNSHDLMEMLKICENSAIDIRKNAEINQNVKKEELEKIGAKNLFDITVTLEDDVLKVATPYTFNRGGADRFTLSDEVGAAIQRYICDNNAQLFHFSSLPLVCVMTRTAPKFVASRIRDNDNVEAGRIMNIIFSHIGYSDNPKNVSIYSNFKECADFEGVIFYIFSRKNIANHLELF